MGSSAVTLFLALALVVCVTFAERKCLLSGTWRSDTGCRMVVSVLSEDSRFSGSYLPGSAAGGPEILTSVLEGSQQDAGVFPQPTFSFTVHWRLQDSEIARTTAFLGQCYVGTKGEETLHALWLMREAADNPGDDWKATRWVIPERGLAGILLACSPAGKEQNTMPASSAASTTGCLEPGASYIAPSKGAQCSTLECSTLPQGEPQQCGISCRIGTSTFTRIN